MSDTIEPMDGPTIERTDPMSAVNGLPLTLLGGAGAVVYAIVMSAFNARDIDYPFLVVIAIAAVAAAFGLLSYAASPLRPPVSRRVHAAGLTLLLGAMALNAAAMAHSNGYIQDDWGTIVIGLFSLFLCPYRPPRELVSFAVLAAIFAAFIVLLQVPTLVSPLPPLVFVVVAITPLVALSFAGAAFASVVLRMTARWRNRSAVAVQAFAAERLPGITRSVQQERVTILNRDVLPFFSEVLARDTVTQADRDRAAAIARSIRAVVVNEVERTWLEAVVAEVFRGAVESSAVDDPQRLASGMTTDQRTAIRALLVGLADRPSLDPASILITVGTEKGRTVGAIEAALVPPDSLARSLLAPYLAVIGVVFPISDVDLSSASLTVRFEYDQH